MFKIAEELSCKNVIERSKFLGFVFNCESTKHQTELLKSIKSLHSSASHVCYASAIFDGNEILYYSCDDGEPSGTAGLQILNSLKENEMVGVLCVVVRYFGGIKLGVPGLSRAYKSTAQQILEDNKKNCEKKFLYQIDCTYEQYNMLKKFFSKKRIQPNDVKFQNNICVAVALSNDDYEDVQKRFNIKRINGEAFYC